MKNIWNIFKNYSHYKQVKQQEELLLRIIKNNPSSGLNLAVLGLIYEYILMDINYEHLILYLQPKYFQTDFIQKIESDPQLFVVSIVVINSIKEIPFYKNNFFFKIFIQNLENNQIPMPLSKNLLFPRFIHAYRNIYNNKQLIKLSIKS